MEREQKIKTASCFIIFVLTFLLYANTISHDYVFDDSVVITNNEFTKKGFGGIKELLLYDVSAGSKKPLTSIVGGRYRPLSMVTFAVEYEFFGENPHVSHFVNVVLYGLAGVLIYIILSRLLVGYPAENWYLSIPFLTAILFVAHPIHTEVVANIKGRDEIMALLGSLITLWLTLQYLDLKKRVYLVYIFIAFFLALLSKENSITFVVIIPLTAYFFTKKRAKRIFSALVPVIVATIIFLVIRLALITSPTTQFVGDIMGNPFISASFAQKYATIFYTLGLYIKLLFYPHPLTIDYYPFNIPIINWADPRAIIPFVIYLALAIYAISKIGKKSIVSYGILFFLVTLLPVSNITFPVGIFMSERFVFTPSLGFFLIIAYLLCQKIPGYINSRKITLLILLPMLIIILSLYSFKTVARNAAWKDRFTLYTTDVQTSANGVFSNTWAANELYLKALEDKEKRNGYFESAIKYLNKAIELYSQNIVAYSILGDLYVDYDEKYNDAIRCYREVLKVEPHNYDANFRLGKLYGKYLNDVDTSIQYLNKAIELDPKGAEAFYNLGIAYGIKKDYKKSAEMLETAVGLKPNNARYLKLLGTTYGNLGEEEKAREYYDKADKLSKH